jgi:small subunit ribosomal protein S21
MSRTPRDERTEPVAEIRLDEGDSVERALKQFRRKLQKEGLFKELRRRRHYLKPSAARVLKAQMARQRKRKKRRALAEL